MAIAYAQYLGNGSTRNFNVNFPYISRSHVQVKVNGVPTTYTWLSSTTLQLPTAPAVGAIVDVRRVTPRDTLLVDFVDGSTLVETDLDLSALQVFYLAQEAFDLGEASLGVTEDGSFSALGRRISQVSPPIGPTDVVTKIWAETAMSSQVVQASNKASEATNSAAQALAHKNAAVDFATTASTKAGEAATSATTASTKAGEAAGYADAAAASASTATTKASEAAQSAADALQYKNAAAQSAADAALFDPSNYYTKSQIDSALGSNGRRDLTVSTAEPTGGADGDVWYQI